MLKLLSGGLCGFAIIPFLLHLGALTLPTPTLEPARWLHEVLIIKARIANETRHPQLLLLAGSNALFSFSAKTIAETYGIPATNLGTGAGLGRRYLLSYAKRLVKPGDVVVLPLEYELWELERYQPMLYYEVLAHDHDYYRSLPQLDKLRLLANVRLSDWLRFVKNQIVPDEPRADGYQSATLNEHGDETHNLKGTAAEELVAKLARDRTRRFQFSDDAIADLKAFDDYTRSIGARMVLTYPNFFAPAFDPVNEAFIEQVRRRAEEAGLVFVGAHHDRLFGPDDVYDTAYHENHEGQVKSTHILMRQLNAAHVALPHPAISMAR